MSLTDSEDSEESSDDCVVVEEVKTKPKPKPSKTIKSTPNVMQFKPQFIPGKAFDENIVSKSVTSVRKRNKCLTNRLDNQLSPRHSIESLDGYDSDVTVIDEDYSPDDWRNGPAKLWYDKLGLPEDCQQYDYGFQLKADNKYTSSVSSAKNTIDSEDAFNLVSQIHWEKNVIWDSDIVRQKIMKSVDRPSIAGWIPVEDNRTAPEFFKQIDDNIINKLVKNQVIHNEIVNECNEEIKCDKQTKNKTTIYGLSRKRKVKFCDNDSESCPKKTYGVENIRDVVRWVSTLPEENRELALNLWEDEIIWDPKAMVRIPEPKIIPFSCDDDNAIIEWNDSDDNSNDSNSMTDILKQLSFNISNDEFYASVTRADSSATHNLTITHSVPALDLHELCFPSWNHDFFRPTLKKSRRFPSKVNHSILLCTTQTDIHSSDHSSDLQTSNDLSKYLIKNISELTARNGQLVLMEYSEESPPLVIRVGMGSQLFNYFNKTKDKNFCPEQHRFAQTKAVTVSPFIGDIGAGKSQLALENNLFRSPIWEHTFPDTDFLVIRTDNNYYIREIDGLFVVGQTLPLMEAPALRSKAFSNFSKQFAKLFIHRYFNGRKSVTNLDKELIKAFPNHTKHFLCKTILKQFTQKINNDRFELKCSLPFEIQINDLLTPENCCAYYSTAITAATTLKAIGVGDRLILNDEDINDCKELEKLSFAPWNTTAAYIGSVNARKFLNVHDYDLDGSLVFKTQSFKEFKDRMPASKRCQPLSDLSLKRLSLKKAHEWLNNFGMSRNKIRNYKSVDRCRKLIKDLSDSLKESGITVGMNKTRSTEQHYKLECQKIFDLHSRFYSKQDSDTDETDAEEESDEESDSDLEELGQDLEAMIVDNKTLEEIEFEREERERKEWLQTIKGQKDPKQSQPKARPSYKEKVLKIIRTYEENGQKYDRVEIVRNPKVIEPYVRIRTTRDDEFIRQLSFIKNHTESGLNTKTINKSLNCIKKSANLPKTVSGVLKTVSENVSNIRNGFINNSNNNNIKEYENIDINSDNWDINESTVEDKETLVRVDGSKIKFSKKVVIEANEIEAEEQRRIQEEKEELERSKTVSYFVSRTSNRVRVDPMVKLKDIFDKVVVDVRKREELDESIDWFMEPIRVKDVPDYYDVIKNPIDLMTIRQKIRRGMYSSREEFLKDIKLIHENSLEYNGDNEITADAQKLFNYCKEKLDSMEDCVGPLEQMYKTMSLNGKVP